MFLKIWKICRIFSVNLSSFPSKTCFRFIGFSIPYDFVILNSIYIIISCVVDSAMNIVYSGFMDSSKRLKRSQEFESQNETDRVEDKRQCMALKSTGDGFEEFVALLDRIHYMKTRHMNVGISEETSKRESLNLKVLKTKSTWVPSFIWEDFFVSAVKDTMPAESNICGPSRKELISSEEKGKQID